MRQCYLFTILLVFTLLSCDDNNSPKNTDVFDRAAMLTDWAEDQILPNYSEYTSATQLLLQATLKFQSSTTITNLDKLKDAYSAAYLRWQTVSFYEIGPAEANSLRSFTNIYPTDTAEIEAHIRTGNYNLELPSTFDNQGFPALDYLLHSEDASTIIEQFSNNNRLSYLVDLATRINSLANQTYLAWVSDYMDAFIANDGSSGTASVDKMVNDYLFHYEKFFRAGKLGIPLGIFSNTPLPDNVESRYDPAFSRTLFIANHTALKKFYLGDDSQSPVSLSLSHYLQDLERNGIIRSIDGDIKTQFEAIDEKINQLGSSLVDQISNNDPILFELYDEIQKMVILLKVDMMQALNIQVDFVDADGD